ncbi:MAG: kynureninase [Planctomycetota bacterium]|nr:MAG: kynureninase [Planctomycetota bacterium]
MIAIEALASEPNALWPDYGRFRVHERVLLTGHSHQAWPDVAWQGVARALEDAARYVDDKWERAFEQAERVRRGYAERLGDREGRYALGASVHELLVRFLSALPLERRPQIVTTDGEFHSVRRQLDALGERGCRCVRVPAQPAADVGLRLAERVDERTAAVVCSAVFYETAAIAGGLDGLARRCAERGAQLLVDVYHALNVVPFSIAEHGLERAFVTGGGYKYMQLGEGCAFLRIPPDCRLRPTVTGWFAEFDRLEQPAPGRLAYPGGAARFAGATYDPVSHYRAAAVLAFFERRGLTVPLLRRVSLHQIARLEQRFDALGLPAGWIDRDRSLPRERRGGFLPLRTPYATALVPRLRARGVFVDARGDRLRLGPAPYVSDRQLDRAIALLGEEIERLVRGAPPRGRERTCDDT